MDQGHGFDNIMPLNDVVDEMLFSESDFNLFFDEMNLINATDEQVNNNNDNNNDGTMIPSVSEPGNNVEASGSSSTKKKYQRRTDDQIHALEAAFMECPHPDEARRIMLSQQLGLDPLQVKFWFQNKRNQTKSKAEHNNNILLKDENDKLRTENAALKSALTRLMCTNCKTSVPFEPSDKDALVRENARLREHIALASTDEGLAGSMNSYPAINSDIPPLTMIASSSTQPVRMEAQLGTNSAGWPQLGFPESSAGVHIEPSWKVELALNAMNELLHKIDESNTTLWIKGLDGISAELLNYDEYVTTFPRIFSTQPSDNFVYEANKDTAVVQCSCQELVATLMNSELWMKMFPSLISTATTIEVIASSMDGTMNETLLLAKLQVLTPLVPLCKLKFLRYCKQIAVGKWAIADVSVDDFLGILTAEHCLPFRQLPSGCIIEEFPNDSSKVTWVAHYEYDENCIVPPYRPMLRAGLGFGSTTWLARLKRQCESIAFFRSGHERMSIRSLLNFSRSLLNFLNYLIGLVLKYVSETIPLKGQKGLLKLGQLMSDCFCHGICSSKFQWENIQTGTLENGNVIIKSRISIDNESGQPFGIVLSAATSIWLPVTRKELFNHLKNRWGLLYKDLTKILHLRKSQENDTNYIALFNQHMTPRPTMVVQEIWSDNATASMIVYAPLPIADISAVCDGQDSIPILPSGFAMHSDGSGGSVLTIGAQLIPNNGDHPTNGISTESINLLNAIIGFTSTDIKAAMG
ncbi:hypothetical protein QQ045_010461 [Rhodiola kirilowii]